MILIMFATSIQIGKTMVFLKQQAAKDLTKIQRERLSAWDPVVSVLEAACAKKRYRRQVVKQVPNLMRVQAHIRR